MLREEETVEKINTKYKYNTHLSSYGYNKNYEYTRRLNI